ncbi:MAG TPA: tetratricopeptide repeat protein [Candidatus Dormibacteraeota bacterium]
MTEVCGHCGSHLIDRGWCRRCGRRAEVTGAIATTRRFTGTGPPLAPPPAYARRPPARSGRASRSPRDDRLGAGLVEVPPIPTTEPEAAVLDDPRVAEVHRFCWNPDCRKPVGRSRPDRPAKDKGFCPSCQAQFSFVPVLASGEVVAGKYEVAGCLAHGGQGWIYLARDRDVAGHWVVLKGVVQPGDEKAVATAVAERQFLAQVRHPNVVRIHTAVEHGGNGYIVMEYLGGRTLRSIQDERGRPLPVGVAIAYVLGLLPAFAYLHELGLVYADFKPDNAMVQEDREIKLIDLGAVKRLDDRESAILGTRSYQAPEVERYGLSEASDLFTIARTLAELALGTNDVDGTLEPSAASVLDRHESLHRFLAKGAAAQPAERFQSAGEMAEQLRGVLREVVAVETGRPRPGVSVRFGGDLHARRGGSGPDWRALPAVAVDGTDPAAGVVDEAAALDPARQDAVLADAVAQGRVPDTAEIRLARARALIDLGRAGAAEPLLAAVEAEDPWDWRVTWYRSLAQLDGNDPRRAAEGFARVHFDLPGELAPKLAEALASERAGDLARAAALYAAVVATDPGFTSAAVGLARVREAGRDRAGAAAAYDLVPETSSARLPARMAKARALVRRAAGFEPTAADLVAADAIIDALPPDQRLAGAALTVELLEAALGLLVDGLLAAAAGVRLRRRPLDERGVRLALETAYRDLARHDPAADADALIDRANEIRPVTFL